MLDFRNTKYDPRETDIQTWLRSSIQPQAEIVALPTAKAVQLAIRLAQNY